MAQGLTNAGIAKSLVISAGAVEKHISSLFLRLGLHQRADDHRRVLAVMSFLQRQG